MIFRNSCFVGFIISILVLGIGDRVLGKLVSNVVFLFFIKSELNHLRYRPFFQADKLLREAIILAPNDRAIRWAAGRLFLSQGKFYDARNALFPLSKVTDEKNPFLFLDVITAFSGVNDFDAVTSYIYQNQKLSQNNRLVRETIAAVYLRWANSIAPENDLDIYLKILHDTLQLTPENVVALYYLDQLDRSLGQTYELQQPSLQSLEPISPQLFQIFLSMIPLLLETGSWPPNLTTQVISYLVWKYYQNPFVETLLQTLKDKYPADLSWHFYLDELYNRRKESKSARVSHRIMVPIDESYWDVRNTRNDDIQISLDKPKQHLVSIVADILKIDQNMYQLGRNLVENGDYEIWSRPELWERLDSPPWRWSHMFNRDGYNMAAFVGGRDSYKPYDGQYSLRISGIWVANRTPQGSARAGYWYGRFNPQVVKYSKIILKAKTPYVIDFYYRTDSLLRDGDATIWISDTSETIFLSDHGLPATDGSWSHYVIVGSNNLSKDKEIFPLVRLFDQGSVWFDNFSIREVHLFNSLKVDPLNLPRFWSSSG